MTEEAQPTDSGKISAEQPTSPLRPAKGRIVLFWRRCVAFTKLRILHITDTPHRISIGMAAGVFVGIAAAPIIGTHMVLALAMAYLLRGNKFAAVAGAWVSNPLTIAPIVVGAYELGKSIMRLFGSGQTEDISQLVGFLKSWEREGMTGLLSEPGVWREFAGHIYRFGAELWIGCLILGIIAAVLSYFAAKEIIIEHRKKNPHRRHRAAI